MLKVRRTSLLHVTQELLQVIATLYPDTASFHDLLLNAQEHVAHSITSETYHNITASVLKSSGNQNTIKTLPYNTH